MRLGIKLDTKYELEMFVKAWALDLPDFGSAVGIKFEVAQTGRHRPCHLIVNDQANSRTLRSFNQTKATRHCLLASSSF